VVAQETTEANGPRILEIINRLQESDAFEMGMFKPASLHEVYAFRYYCKKRTEGIGRESETFLFSIPPIKRIVKDFELRGGRKMALFILELMINSSNGR
jgi:hypothetical protein